MSILRPTFLLNFASADPQWLDPRITFTRTGVATGMTQMGLVKAVPADVMRQAFHPVTGRPFGIVIEPQRTNLCLRSQEFGTTWTNTNVTVTADSTVAPDGTTTADTLAPTASDAMSTQSITISAGNCATVSVFFKAGASNFGVIRLNDNTNTVYAWYNLLTGLVASCTGSQGGLTYVTHRLEPWGRVPGWYRAQLVLNTAAVTTINFSVGAATADLTLSANGATVIAWGAQFESPGAAARCTSYIPTAGSTVTRGNDNLIVNTNSAFFDAAQGTIFWEFVMPIGVFGNGAGVFGGIGTAFGDHVYTSLGSDGWMRTSVGVSSVAQALPGMNTAGILDSDYAVGKMAVSWKQDAIYQVLNTNVQSDLSALIPPASRIAFSCAPYSAAGGTNPLIYLRRAAYWNQAQPPSICQTITRVN